MLGENCPVANHPWKHVEQSDNVDGGAVTRTGALCRTQLTESLETFSYSGGMRRETPQWRVVGSGSDSDSEGNLSWRLSGPAIMGSPDSPSQEFVY